MDQEDILKLADAARLSVINDEVYPSQPGYITPELTRFAELVAQHAREQNDLEIRRLQAIIDSRPTINAGLPSTYIEWSQQFKTEILEAMKAGEYHSQCTRDKLVAGSDLWVLVHKQCKQITSTIKKVEAISPIEEVK